MKLRNRVGIILGVFTLFSVASAIVVHFTFYLPQEATVASYSLDVYIDDVKQTDAVTFDWGIVQADASTTKQLQVKNAGNFQVRICLYLQGLPSGWTETWAANGTLTSPGGWANGTLTLVVPFGASGSHSWHSALQAETW